MIDTVFLAIYKKWPCSAFHHPIYIQQDNAKPHLIISDTKFVDAAHACGFSICLRCQPPNSLDLNVLDLGFFNAIQSLQYHSSPKLVDDLIVSVKNAFDNLEMEKLDHVSLVLQRCITETLCNNGGNNYKIPHVGKKVT